LSNSAAACIYANNRYYSNAYGRFMTPDPYKASGGPSDPGSWNRYTYTRGDPVNRYDPDGQHDCGPEGANFTCDGPPILFPGGPPGASYSPQEIKGMKGAPPPCGLLCLYGRLNNQLHALTANIFASLSTQCANALTDDGINLNALATTSASTQYYATEYYGGTAVFSITGDGALGTETLSEYNDGAVASVLPRSGGLANAVVLNASFFTNSDFGATVTASQVVVLLHEALHIATGENDTDLASTLGLGTITNGTAASNAISEWLQYGCAPTH
jgi:RHS repeat-associated protein